MTMIATSLIPLAIITKWERLRDKDYERKWAILRQYGNFVDKSEDKMGTMRQGLNFTAKSDDGQHAVEEDRAPVDASGPDEGQHQEASS